MSHSSISVDHNAKIFSEWSKCAPYPLMTRQPTFSSRTPIPITRKESFKTIKSEEKKKNGRRSVSGKEKSKKHVFSHVCRNEIQEIIQKYSDNEYSGIDEEPVSVEEKEVVHPFLRFSEENRFKLMKTRTPKLLRIEMEKKEIIREALHPFAPRRRFKRGDSQSSICMLEEPVLTESEELRYNVPITNVHSTAGKENILSRLYQTEIDTDEEENLSKATAEIVRNINQRIDEARQSLREEYGDDVLKQMKRNQAKIKNEIAQFMSKKAMKKGIANERIQHSETETSKDGYQSNVTDIPCKKEARMKVISDNGEISDDDKKKELEKVTELRKVHKALREQKDLKDISGHNLEVCQVKEKQKKELRVQKLQPAEFPFTNIFSDEDRDIRNFQLKHMPKFDEIELMGHHKDIFKKIHLPIFTALEKKLNDLETEFFKSMNKTERRDMDNTELGDYLENMAKDSFSKRERILIENSMRLKEKQSLQDCFRNIDDILTTMSVSTSEISADGLERESNRRTSIEKINEEVENMEHTKDNSEHKENIPISAGTAHISSKENGNRNSEENQKAESNRKGTEDIIPSISEFASQGHRSSCDVTKIEDKTNESLVDTNKEDQSEYGNYFSDYVDRFLETELESDFCSIFEDDIVNESVKEYNDEEITKTEEKVFNESCREASSPLQTDESMEEIFKKHNVSITELVPITEHASQETASIQETDSGVVYINDITSDQLKSCIKEKDIEKLIALIKETEPAELIENKSAVEISVKGSTSAYVTGKSSGEITKPEEIQTKESDEKKQFETKIRIPETENQIVSECSLVGKELDEISKPDEVSISERQAERDTSNEKMNESISDDKEYETVEKEREEVYWEAKTNSEIVSDKAKENTPNEGYNDGRREIFIQQSMKEFVDMIVQEVEKRREEMSIREMESLLRVSAKARTPAGQKQLKKTSINHNSGIVLLTTPLSHSSLDQDDDIIPGNDDFETVAGTASDDNSERNSDTNDNDVVSEVPELDENRTSDLMNNVERQNELGGCLQNDEEVEDSEESEDEETSDEGSSEDENRRLTITEMVDVEVPAGSSRLSDDVATDQTPKPFEAMRRNDSLYLAQKTLIEAMEHEMILEPDPSQMFCQLLNTACMLPPHLVFGIKTMEPFQVSDIPRSNSITIQTDLHFNVDDYIMAGGSVQREEKKLQLEFEEIFLGEVSTVRQYQTTWLHSDSQYFEQCIIFENCYLLPSERFLSQVVQQTDFLTVVQLEKTQKHETVKRTKPMDTNNLPDPDEHYNKIRELLVKTKAIEEQLREISKDFSKGNSSKFPVSASTKDCILKLLDKNEPEQETVIPKEEDQKTSATVLTQIIEEKTSQVLKNGETPEPGVTSKFRITVTHALAPNAAVTAGNVSVQPEMEQDAFVIKKSSENIEISERKPQTSNTTLRLNLSLTDQLNISSAQIIVSPKTSEDNVVSLGMITDSTTLIKNKTRSQRSKRVKFDSAGPSVYRYAGPQSSNSSINLQPEKDETSSRSSDSSQSSVRKSLLKINTNGVEEVMESDAPIASLISEAVSQGFKKLGEVLEQEIWRERFSSSNEEDSRKQTKTNECQTEISLGDRMETKSASSEDESSASSNASDKGKKSSKQELIKSILDELEMIKTRNKVLRDLAETSRTFSKTYTVDKTDILPETTPSYEKLNRKKDIRTIYGRKETDKEGDKSEKRMDYVSQRNELPKTNNKPGNCLKESDSDSDDFKSVSSRLDLTENENPNSIKDTNKVENDANCSYRSTYIAPNSFEKEIKPLKQALNSITETVNDIRNHSNMLDSMSASVCRSCGSRTFLCKDPSLYYVKKSLDYRQDILQQVECWKRKKMGRNLFNKSAQRCDKYSKGTRGNPVLSCLPPNARNDFGSQSHRSLLSDYINSNHINRHDF